MNYKYIFGLIACLVLISSVQAITWTYSGGNAYSSSDTVGYNVTKFNVSGAFSITIPSNVYNVELLMTGAGASGAGQQFAGGGVREDFYTMLHSM